MSNITLYDALDNLKALIETEEGGVPEELRQEFEAELKSGGELALNKIDACIGFIKAVEASIEYKKAFIKTESARLKELIEADEKQLQKFTEYIRGAVEQYAPEAGKNKAKKLTGRIGSLALYKNPDKLSDELDETAIPDEFITQTVTLDISPAEWESVKDWIPEGVTVTVVRGIDKAAIKKQLVAKKHVPGAKLAPETKRLQVV